MPGNVPFSVSRSIRSATSRLKSGSMKSSESRLASFCRVSRVTGKCVIGRTLTAPEASSERQLARLADEVGADEAVFHEPLQQRAHVEIVPLGEPHDAPREFVRVR